MACAFDALMSTRFRCAVAIGSMLVMPAPAFAQATAPAPRVPLFTIDDAYLAGGFIVGTLVTRPVDQVFARKLQNKNSQSSRFLQDVAVTFRTIAEPGAFFIGGTLYIA